jgi:hypothetical protein
MIVHNDGASMERQSASQPQDQSDDGAYEVRRSVFDSVIVIRPVRPDLTPFSVNRESCAIAVEKNDAIATAKPRNAD